MRNTKARLLVLGEYAFGTGFDRVSRHILRAANEEFEIHMYAIGYTGEPFIDPSGVHIHSYQVTLGDRYGTKGFGELINHLEPALVLVFFDLTFLRYQLEALRFVKKRVPIIAYQALDGHIFKRRKLISHLAKLDLCVWFTQFAHSAVLEATREQPSLLERPLRQEIIPHGVDTEVFHPIHPDRQAARLAARKAVFPSLATPEDAFIAMNGNRMHSRKRHDLTIRAFAQFAAGKPQNVFLYLHLSECHPGKRKGLQKHADELGIGERLLMGPPLEGGPVDSQTLNLYYNATDVGFTTTGGEGWGLVSCEHGAAGVAQIVPRHTSFPEIWENAARIVDAGSLNEDASLAVWHYEVQPSSVAAQLEDLYQQPDLRREMGDRARKRMSDPYFNWKRIEDQWKNVLRSMVPQTVNNFHL